MSDSHRKDLKASRLRFAAAATVNSLGNGLFLTVSALYFVRIAGLHPIAYGAALAIAAAVGLLAGPLIGHLADRRGTQALYALLLALQGVGSAAYVLSDEAAFLVAVICLVAITERGASALRGAYTAALVPRENRVRFRAILRSLSNAAGGVGAGLGAMVLVVDEPWAYRLALVVNALSFFVAALLIILGRRVPNAPTVTGAPSASWSAALRDRPFVVVTILNAVLLLHICILTVAVPLWVGSQTDAPLWVVGMLIVINTAGVVLLQVPATKGISTIRTAARAATQAALLLALSCAILAFTGLLSGVFTVAALVLATIVHLGGELLQSAAAWTFAFELAPESAHGQYQGVFNAGLDVGTLFAPIIFTAIVSEGTPLGWLLVAALFVVVGGVIRPVARWAESSLSKEKNVGAT